MNFLPEPSKDTPFGLSMEAAATFQPFVQMLRRGDMPSGALQRAGVAELIERGLIRVKPDQGDDNWLLSVTPRGRVVLDGLKAWGRGEPLPTDGRSVDDITQSLLDLQAARRELEPQFQEARAAFAPVVANAAKRMTAQTEE